MSEYYISIENLGEKILFNKIMKNVFATITVIVVIISHPPCPCGLVGAIVFVPTGIAWYVFRRRYKKLLAQRGSTSINETTLSLDATNCEGSQP